ncbi:MAG TPA: hypothetical protein VH478_01530 [Trebonia sp.]|nr:hypothetical protein [Trebonia sp.]
MGTAYLSGWRVAGRGTLAGDRGQDFPAPRFPGDSLHASPHFRRIPRSRRGHPGRSVARELAVTLPVTLTALRTLTSIDALVHDPGYFVPGERDPASPAPVAGIIAWSDGTRTRLPAEVGAGSA